MWLNYQQLQYFREIAHKGSIAKASEELKVSPPALSKQLKQLEEMLGDKLFYREKRRLILTYFGEYVLDYADKIFSTGEELISNINNRLYKNIFKVGVSAGLPKIITTGLIEHVAQNFYETTIQVIEGDDNQLLKNLLSHNCDIIFTDKKLYFQDDSVTSKKFYQSPLGFYATKNFEWLIKNFPESMDGAPLILPSVHSHLRNQIDDWYSKKNFHYTLIAELQDSGSKKLLAMNHKGLIVIPEIGARYYVQNNELIKIGDLEENESFFYTIRKSDQTNITRKILKELNQIWI